MSSHFSPYFVQLDHFSFPDIKGALHWTSIACLCLSVWFFVSNSVENLKITQYQNYSAVSVNEFSFCGLL